LSCRQQLLFDDGQKLHSLYQIFTLPGEEGEGTGGERRGGGGGMREVGEE